MLTDHEWSQLDGLLEEYVTVELTPIPDDPVTAIGGFLQGFNNLSLSLRTVSFRVNPGRQTNTKITEVQIIDREHVVAVTIEPQS